jgi:predicted molibdopterin-dependent oxidoreductase YjgC
MSQRPNEQGVIDMGCLPDLLTGDRPLGVGSFREKFEKEMGYSVPPKEGLTLFEMFEGMKSGRIRAAYIMGDNPVFNLPSSERIKGALEKLEFLVVQDIFSSETAQIADVVLPSSSWSEKEGTFVNLERRIQKLNKAKSSTAGMDDWMILMRIARLMGSRMEYTSVSDIWHEITRASHLYGSLGYDELASDKALWPYKGEPLRGALEDIPVPAGNGSVPGTRYRIYPDRSMFHSGTLSRYSPALNSIQAEPYAVVGPEAALDFGVREGDRVRITAAGKTLELLCKIDRNVTDSSVRIVNVFEGVCAMSLMEYDIDNHTKAAVLKLPEITLEKVS